MHVEHAGICLFILLDSRVVWPSRGVAEHAVQI